MRPFDDPVSMTPNERRAAVANVLAAGILRFHTRDALSEKAANLPAPKKLSKPGSSCLEVPDETVLSATVFVGILHFLYRKPALAVDERRFRISFGV